MKWKYHADLHEIHVFLENLRGLEVNVTDYVNPKNEEVAPYVPTISCPILYYLHDPNLVGWEFYDQSNPDMRPPGNPDWKKRFWNMTSQQSHNTKNSLKAAILDVISIN